MELKPGYKLTEVGMIPADWDVSCLALISKLSSGTTPSRSQHDHYYRNGKYHWVKTTDLNNSRITTTEEKVTQAALDETCLQVYPPGTVFVAMYGGFNQIGRTGILEIPAAVNQALIAIQTKTNKLDPAYLLANLNYRVEYWKSVASSSRKDPNITSQDVKNFAVPIPNVNEQRSIATALSDMDALLAALDRLIAKKRDLKQAAMQQLLTGKTRLPGFGGEWEVKRIGDIATSVSDKNITGEALPVLTCSKHLGFMDSLGFFKNQVFSKDLSTYKIIRRGQIGYPANHVEEGSIGLQNLYDVALVSPIYVVLSVAEDINSFFLHRVLKLDSYRQKFKTATTSSVDRRGSLRWPAFSKITVKVPTLIEQSAIASTLSDMDTEIATLEQRHDKTRALKQAMMQELLTGKIRLI